MSEAHSEPLSTIQLFAGGGGGVWADLLLEHEPILYVEREPTANRILRSRIADSSFPDAPIWPDIRTLDASMLRGQVDVVCGGFPCQFASMAARGRHTAENLWPEMRRVVAECQPPLVFAENVTREAIEPAAQDLFDDGYTCAYTVLSTAHLGGTHRRRRWWLLAYADPEGKPGQPRYAEMEVRSSLPGVAWEEDISRTLGVDDGVAGRVQRLRTLGNGQTPLVAAAAFRALASVLGLKL